MNEPIIIALCLLILVAGGGSTTRFFIHMSALHHLRAVHVDTVIVDFYCGGAASPRAPRLFIHTRSLHPCVRCLFILQLFISIAGGLRPPAPPAYLHRDGMRGDR